MSGLAINCDLSNADNVFFSRHADRTAVELCVECPLMLRCRDQARREGEIWGTWGGETAEERCAWLAENHPDINVRYEAKKQVSEFEQARERDRRAAVRRKSVVREPEPVKSRSVQHREARRLDPGSPRLRKMAETAEKVRRLSAGGMSQVAIARELRISDRSVRRYLGTEFDHVNA